MISDSTYKEIKRFAISLMRKTKDPQHDVTHVKRVRNHGIKIAKLLGLSDQIDINLLKAACLLHELTYTMYGAGINSYFFEGRIMKEKLPKMLEKFDISEEDKHKIISAVFHHPHSYPFGKLNKGRDVYTKVLQDADTFDLFHQGRIESFEKHQNFSFLYKIAHPFSKIYVEFGKKHIGEYLNYPQLTKYISKELSWNGVS